MFPWRICDSSHVPAEKIQSRGNCKFFGGEGGTSPPPKDACNKHWPTTALSKYDDENSSSISVEWVADLTSVVGVVDENERRLLADDVEQAVM